MTENFNEGYISCSKCRHNENASTALKCEICGHQLQKAATSPKPLIFGLILLLGILGAGGYFLFRDKLTTAQTQNVIAVEKEFCCVINPMLMPKMEFKNLQQVIMMKHLSFLKKR
jgi:uncharacterized protein (DUF983 family)